MSKISSPIFSVLLLTLLSSMVIFLSTTIVSMDADALRNSKIPCQFLEGDCGIFEGGSPGGGSNNTGGSGGFGNHTEGGGNDTGGAGDGLGNDTGGSADQRPSSKEAPDDLGLPKPCKSKPNLPICD